jgi:hypothetical protein
MAIDLLKLDKVGLKNLIDNHRKNDATDKPLYLEAIGEYERRFGNGLDFDKTMRIVREAARAGNFLSYKDVADASGAKWNVIHHTIGKHLGGLVEYAHKKGWPLLSAIIVNKPNVEIGKMDPAALKGFIQAARELGYPVTDEEAFLKEMQNRVFVWAQNDLAH